MGEKNIETIETDKYSEIIENVEDENVEEVVAEELDSTDDGTLDAAPDVVDETEDFEEVLQLTQYSDGSLETNNLPGVAAEYKNIDVVKLSKKHDVAAKSFVSKITKFILEFNDVTLSTKHKEYIKQVGNLQVQHLSDLMYMVEVNKGMMNNIIERVNVTQAEDYAIVNSYNNLTNQHLKLIKELQNLYKSIPNVLKKMRTDVICEQELEATTNSEEVITEDYGETQFNNQKQVLRNLLDKRKKREEEKEEKTDEAENAS